MLQEFVTSLKATLLNILNSDKTCALLTLLTTPSICVIHPVPLFLYSRKYSVVQQWSDSEMFWDASQPCVATAIKSFSNVNLICGRNICDIKIFMMIFAPAINVLTYYTNLFKERMAV